MSVYIITDRKNGVAKIGYSLTPKKRLSMLRTSSAADLHLEAVVPGDVACERALHKKFSPLHVRREWFRLGPEIEELIGAHRVGHMPRLRRQQNSPVNNLAVVQRIIDKLGGTSAVARLLGQADNTVSNWRARSIPWRWRPKIAELAKERGIEVSPEFLGIAA